MKKFEYKTTYGLGCFGKVNPKEPEGSGWTMCGSSVSDGQLYWFWKRVSPAWQKKEDLRRRALEEQTEEWWH